MNSNNDENISLEDRINHDLYTYTESRRLNSNLESIIGQENYCESPQFPQEKMKIILVGSK